MQVNICHFRIVKHCPMTLISVSRNAGNSQPGSMLLIKGKVLVLFFAILKFHIKSETNKSYLMCVLLDQILIWDLWIPLFVIVAILLRINWNHNTIHMTSSYWHYTCANYVWSELFDFSLHSNLKVYESFLRQQNSSS